MNLDDAVAQLYSKPTSQFVTQRKALVAHAKADGDSDLAKTIAALRKPTASAAIVNGLPRGQLRELVELGQQLRAATTRLDAEEIKRLTLERQALTHNLLTTIDVTPAVREEVSATLTAAVADASAGAAVMSGALVKAIRYSGFGDIDLDEVLAHASSGKSAGRPDSAQTPMQATRTPALRVVEPDPEIEAARQRQRAQARVEKLREELEQAQRRQRAAADALDAAQKAAASADAALTLAEAELRTAEAALGE